MLRYPPPVAFSFLVGLLGVSVGVHVPNILETLGGIAQHKLLEPRKLFGRQPVLALGAGQFVELGEIIGRNRHVRYSLSFSSPSDLPFGNRASSV